MIDCTPLQSVKLGQQNRPTHGLGPGFAMYVLVFVSTIVSYTIAVYRKQERDRWEIDKSGIVRDRQTPLEREKFVE